MVCCLAASYPCNLNYVSLPMIRCQDTYCSVVDIIILMWRLGRQLHIQSVVSVPIYSWLVNSGQRCSNMKHQEEAWGKDTVWGGRNRCMQVFWSKWKYYFSTVQWSSVSQSISVVSSCNSSSCFNTRITQTVPKNLFRRVCIVLNVVFSFARHGSCFVFCVYIFDFCVWGFDKQGPCFRNCVFAIVTINCTIKISRKNVW